jgi:hypothetical protein
MQSFFFFFKKKKIGTRQNRTMGRMSKTDFNGYVSTICEGVGRDALSGSRLDLVRAGERKGLGTVCATVDTERGIGIMRQGEVADLWGDGR